MVRCSVHPLRASDERRGVSAEADVGLRRPARIPMRYDGVTIGVMASCAWCGAPFAPSGRRRYHSDACRQASYRARHAVPGAFREPVRARPEATVYECPNCATRYLGPDRRCPDCNLFCRRIGPGGLCPHCDEPVAHRDLES